MSITDFSKNCVFGLMHASIADDPNVRETIIHNTNTSPALSIKSVFKSSFLNYAGGDANSSFPSYAASNGFGRKLKFAKFRARKNARSVDGNGIVIKTKKFRSCKISTRPQSAVVSPKPREEEALLAAAAPTTPVTTAVVTAYSVVVSAL